MIKMLIPFVLLIICAPAVRAQTEEFVCTPCGNPCDATVSKKGGSCPSCQMSMVPKSTVKVANLDAADFCARIAANPDVTILDVRSEGEFDGTSNAMETFGHFRNAININVTQLAKRISELEKYKDKEILVYCSHSHRSPRAAYYLNMHGFSNVKNLAGGVSELGTGANSACFKEHFVSHKK